MATDVFSLKTEAEKSFKAVNIVGAPTETGWPKGPNALFLKAAEAARMIGSHWLFLEPDAVPLCPGWLDKIEAEYWLNNRPYMGAIVDCDDPRLPSRHFTGVGVYPAAAFNTLKGIIAPRMGEAFDITTAAAVVPHAVNSTLFQHLWGEYGKPPSFGPVGLPGTNLFDLKYLRPEAVLFHRNKDGTLIDLLRSRDGKNLIEKRTFIQLGRFGDIILLLPALKYIAESSGFIPRLVVSRDYASVLDGVSYVETEAVPFHWWQGMQQARDFAQQKFGEACVLQCHGHNWGIELAKWPNFMSSMWDRTGVPLSLMPILPLVFDRRNYDRELGTLPKGKGRPFIVVNCNGHSSPFPYRQHLHGALWNLHSKIDVIDIATLQAHRIFDLLGLMDRALGTITIDTATLHLAHGSQRPYIAFTVDGWTSSVPRGKCALEVKYSQTLTRLPEVVKTVESWL